MVRDARNQQLRDTVTTTYSVTPASGERRFVKQGAHLTKPGWSKPHTHSNPTNLALFRRHKITLYEFNQGGVHTVARGAQMGAGRGR